MAARSATTKANAETTAAKMRKKGFNASVFKKKKGYGISVTRKK
jgi:hypothetical protein